mgnify:CR=1 FL=1
MPNPSQNIRFANTADMRTAAYPREGRARLRLSSKGFTLYYQQVFSPVGLTTEDMPKKAARMRDSMDKFVSRLGEGLDLPLTMGDESHYVLLGIEDRSITLNAEARVVSPKKLTAELIMAQEQAVFDRFGYQVEIL